MSHLGNGLTPSISNFVTQHPTIYEVTDNSDGTKTYTRVETIDTTPYYRWDNTVLPRTEAFPPGFRMIAHSTDAGADRGEIFPEDDEGEGWNHITECCNEGEEDCMIMKGLVFPDRPCDVLGIAFGK